MIKEIRKTLKVLSLLITTLVVFLPGSSICADFSSCATDDDLFEAKELIGTANPSAVYCMELGYEYRIMNTKEGQAGICQFPDKSECPAWDFLAGKCGQSYSYCSKLGYGVRTATDGKDPFSKEYAVCIAGDKSDIGSVVSLFDLTSKSIKNDYYLPIVKSEVEQEKDLPPTFDWRNYNGQNWMTSVKDQGSCGSCWAFSTTGTIEAKKNIGMNNPDYDLDLSEEYLLSCSYGNCCGGWLSTAFEYIRSIGIPDEQCLSYVSSNCQCINGSCECQNGCVSSACADKCVDWEQRIINIDAWSSRLTSLKQVLTEESPVSVAMQVGDGYFDGDIYRCNEVAVNHGVVLVGYDDIGGYWIVKNSWGADWNNDGYFKVGYGECGLGAGATFVYDGCVQLEDSCSSNQDCCSGLCVGDKCTSPPGDGICAPYENCETSPEDCGECICGNGFCDIGENCSSCASDCGYCEINFQSLSASPDICPGQQLDITGKLFTYNPTTPAFHVEFKLIDETGENSICDSIVQSGFGLVEIGCTYQIPQDISYSPKVIKIVADPLNEILENNESDNEITTMRAVCCAGGPCCGDGYCSGELENCLTCNYDCTICPDLTVEAEIRIPPYSLSLNKLRFGVEYLLTAFIRNIGGPNPSQYVTKFMIDNVEVCQFLCNSNVIQELLSCNWIASLSDAQPHTFTVEVDADNVVIESDDMNNSISKDFIIICRDLDGDYKVSVSDVSYLINLVFKGGPAPIPYLIADVNNDGTVNVSDVAYLIAYLFRGGPAPICGGTKPALPPTQEEIQATIDYIKSVCPDCDLSSLDTTTTESITTIEKEAVVW